MEKILLSSVIQQTAKGSKQKGRNGQNASYKNTSTSTSMIDVTQLRLDNWILDNGNPVQVYNLSKGLTHYTVNGVNLDKKTGRAIVEVNGIATVSEEDTFSPIELTPEILEDCGFIKGVSGYQKNVAFPNHRVMIFYIDDDGSFNVAFGCDGSKSNAPHDVIPMFDADNGGKYYLHELQNLYKDLTRQELSYHPSTISEKTE